MLRLVQPAVPPSQISVTIDYHQSNICPSCYGSYPWFCLRRAQLLLLHREGRGMLLGDIPTSGTARKGKNS